MWVRTVGRDTFNSVAIGLAVFPAASSRRISRSREVRAKGRGGTPGLLRGSVPGEEGVEAGQELRGEGALPQDQDEEGNVFVSHAPQDL